MSVTSSISPAAEPSLLYVSTTQTGTPASTDETTLATYTLPANTLSVDGDYIEITATGSFAANGNNKTIQLYFGSSYLNVFSSENNRAWQVFGRIYRTGAATQKTDAILISNSTGVLNGNNSSQALGTLSEDLTSTVIISLTGQNGTANANDIVLETFTVEHKKQ